MFWKLTILIFFLGLIFGGYSINSEEVSNKDLAIACLVYFVFCMISSDLLIDILSCYGVKPV